MTMTMISTTIVERTPSELSSARTLSAMPLNSQGSDVYTCPRSRTGAQTQGDRTPRACAACAAPPSPTPQRPAVALPGVAYQDHPGWSGCGNPQHRSAGNGRRQRLAPDASWPVDHLHGHSFGDEDLDRSPGLQTEVDCWVSQLAQLVRSSRAAPKPVLMVVSAGQLPTGVELEAAVCRLQHEWPGQPPGGGREPDQRRQRQHRCLEVRVPGCSEDLLQDFGEAVVRQRSGAEQVAEPGNGRGPVLSVNSIGRKLQPGGRSPWAPSWPGAPRNVRRASELVRRSSAGSAFAEMLLRATVGRSCPVR